MSVECTHVITINTFHHFVEKILQYIHVICFDCRNTVLIGPEFGVQRSVFYLICDMRPGKTRTHAQRELWRQIICMYTDIPRLSQPRDRRTSATVTDQPPSCGILWPFLVWQLKVRVYRGHTWVHPTGTWLPSCISRGYHYAKMKKLNCFNRFLMGVTDTFEQLKTEKKNKKCIFYFPQTYFILCGTNRSDFVTCTSSELSGNHHTCCELQGQQRLDVAMTCLLASAIVLYHNKCHCSCQ